MKQQETERRFVVTAIDPDIYRAPSERIMQGYFDTPPHYSLRVRIMDGRRAFLTRKDGWGLSRLEEERPVDLETARFLMDSCPDRIHKVRYRKDGWEVDAYAGQLAGLVVAEYESPDAAKAKLPPWITAAREVTDSLTNRHLARLASDLAAAKYDRPVRDLLAPRLRRVVVTGAPCSGKSTLMEGLKVYGGLAVVPETATIVISQVGVLPPRDPVAYLHFQRTIYLCQTGFEEISEAQALAAGKRAMVLDRGTLDGAAYMDHGVRGFESACGTTAAYELSRYDCVIYLAPPPRDVFEREHRNNPARREGYDEAVALGERTAAAWSGHPNFHRVDGKSWGEKAGVARMLVREFLH